MLIAASVVIPAHDAASFITDAIATCLAQTQPDIEIIIVDDGSHDTTWDILAAAAARDRRIRLLRRAAAGGPGAARNAGLALAQGEWIALLDADDLFEPDRLARLIAQAKAAGADLAADNPERRDFASGHSHGTLLPARPAHGPLSLVELVQGDMPDGPPEAKLGFIKPIFRRDFLTAKGLRYAEDIRVGEDFLFLFEALAHGGRCHLFPEPGYVDRLRESSLSVGAESSPYLSAANRRMRALAPSGDTALKALLRRRQLLLDFNSFAYEIARGHAGAALAHVNWDGPAHAFRQFRLAAGAARQQLTGRR